MKSSSDVLIRLPSLAPATAFYRDVMGLTLMSESEALVGFSTGAFDLYLQKGPALGAPVFEFEVDDVEAARGNLVAAGCAVVRWEGIHRWIRDPYGLVFNLIRKSA
jgi:catechol 2,3-dioxygenase-like lactoylglutathione lyase family enzyme